MIVSLDSTEPYAIFYREEWLRCLQEVSNNIHAKEESLPEEKHVLDGMKMVKKPR